MTDFRNLRQNFEHVIATASLADIETMLRVLGTELGPRFREASVLVEQAAEQLHEYRRGKRPQTSPHVHDRGCAWWCVERDRGSDTPAQ